MKKLFTLFLAFYSVAAFAQSELHIHHINIENGDATMIGIFDTVNKKYISKTLIDGGLSAAKDRLLPYLKALAPADANANKFKYVVLSHYHNDHYMGLYALSSGKIVTDSIIDPGAYKFDDVFKQQKNLLPVNETYPQKLEVAQQWLNIVSKASTNTSLFVTGGHSNVFASYGTTSSSAIGKSVVLGKLNNEDVKLTCVAGWGNTLGKDGQIIPNPDPLKKNANNFSLAFILSVGEFRYFLGGDLGGETTDTYIDQERYLVDYFNSAYPLSYSYLKKTNAPAHICGFKANHHGSDHSNNLNFLKTMHPAIGITSAGNNANWHLPALNYIKDLAKLTPLSTWTSSSTQTYSSGYYFTNLYNWGKYNSLTTAIQLLKGADQVSFDYGNEGSAKSSYLIKVKGTEINTMSSFEVYKVSGNNQGSLLARYYCHSK